MHIKALGYDRSVALSNDQRRGCRSLLWKEMFHVKHFLSGGGRRPPPDPPPTRGRSLVAPRKGLRARYSAVKGKYNFRIRSSREKAFNNFDISPFLRVLVAAAQTYSYSVKRAKAEAVKRLSRGMNCPISYSEILPRNPGSAEPFRGIHKGLSPCVGRLGGAKPRQINSTTMNENNRTSHCQNLSRKKKLNNKSRKKEMLHVKQSNTIRKVIKNTEEPSRLGRLFCIFMMRAFRSSPASFPPQVSPPRASLPSSVCN